MVGIRDICSPGLVMAMDFNQDINNANGHSDAVGTEERREWEKGLLNILEANDFDAIPLVKETNGQPSRIAVEEVP